MIGQYGQEYVEEMNNMKHEIYKISTPDIEDLIQLYKGKVKHLTQQKEQCVNTKEGERVE